MMDADLRSFERQARQNGFVRIAGIDEAGRGPLAGPVVAAAVQLPEAFDHPGIMDSKRVSAKNRERLFDTLYAQAAGIGIGIVDASEIDRINILQASLLAMSIAVKQLAPVPDYLLIDGPYGISADIAQLPIVKGDSRSISIAAASIVAKVTRDRIMDRYAIEYPQFGFNRHRGYPTKAHKSAIREFGCCPIHRRSFKGVREVAC